jgi:hypothetical protein
MSFKFTKNPLNKTRALSAGINKAGRLKRQVGWVRQMSQQGRQTEKAGRPSQTDEPTRQAGWANSCAMEVLRGRLITVVLLVLTSLDQICFMLTILFSFFTKQTTLITRLTIR